MLRPISYIIFYGSAFSSFRMLIGSISALYLIHNGFSLSEVGLIKTFQALVIFALEIPISIFSDKNSRKLSAILSVFFGAIWLMIMGLGSEKWHFFLAEFFNAISLALTSGAFIAYIIDSGKKEDPTKHSKYWIGKYEKFLFFGMAVCSFVGGAFISTDNKYIWIVSSLLCFFLLVFFSWLLPEDKNKEGKEKNNSSIEILKEVFKTMESIRVPKSFIVSLVLIMVFYQILIQYWQPLTSDFISDSYSKSGFIFGAILSVSLIAQSFAGYVCEKVSSVEKSLTISIISNALCVAALFISINYIKELIIFSIVFMFFGCRLLTSSLNSMIQQEIQSSIRATLSSVISMITRILILIIMPLFGYMVTVLSWNAIILIYAAPLIYLIISKNLAKNDIPDPEPETLPSE